MNMIAVEFIFVFEKKYTLQHCLLHAKIVEWNLVDSILLKAGVWPYKYKCGWHIQKVILVNVKLHSDINKDDIFALTTNV